MSNATDTHAAMDVSTAPEIGCPDWCTRGTHAWERDGDDFVRDHDGAEMASPGASYSLTLFAVDWWNGGVLSVGRAHVRLQLADEFLEPEDVTRLAADMARAQTMAADTTRRKR